MVKHFYYLWISLVLMGCQSAKTNENPSNFTSENLRILKIGEQVYQHTSYLNTESFGKVDCNGMIVFDGKEAVIFNTTADDVSSAELINWVQNSLHCKIKAIIPTHFHADCLGGLAAFHQQGIPSYASNATIQLAQAKNVTVPKTGFADLLELKVGDKQVLTEFLGEGHTRDNVIGYFPSENMMFGGCLIKEVGAGKGNLEDANVSAWPATVNQLKAKYPDVKLIVPGHGKSGGTELLDYTVKLFSGQ
ncbi:subclass B1 metallo-beta-lactamase [Adhaeribacter pallidiroseus]|uniref:Beta-lactamase n=1 Tax=Adhaeribacter pallidiroseus TaxID=2072847 RepID=A0A369QEL5_9BACT|nr:subclass B1 metallo-beta-lactamase [Adhaeribacter pallidiroseus]RDC62750.1 Beta-lactamase [Adhaeribacter pallidiroseus]